MAFRDLLPPLPSLSLPVAGSAGSRLAAWGLLAGLAILLAEGLGAPLLDVFGDSGEAALLRHRRDSLRLLLERRPAVEADALRLRGAWEQGDDFLRAATPALAAADLQSRVATIVTADKGRVGSTLGLPERGDGGLRRIGIEVHLTARIEALRGILYQIESGRPRLRIDSLTIHPTSTDATGSAVSPDLDVVFSVFGYLPDEAK